MNIVKIPIPNLTPDEVLIKVLYTGICGSDIHAFKGEYNKVIPLTLGHEFVGEIVEIGEAVQTFQIGDQIVSETTYTTCGSCSHCLNHEYNLCSKRKGIGTQVDGSFAEFVLSKAARCHLVPKNVDLRVAAITEPLACCIHAAIEKTKVEPGEKIAVFGPGPIGTMLALVLQALGAEIILIGIEKDHSRLNQAKDMKISHVINSSQTDLESYINGLAPEGVDQVFECAGSPIALEQAMTILKKKGRLIQEGLFATEKIPINVDLLIHKELEYIGSRTQKPSSWETALRWLEEDKIDLLPLISNVFPLEEWFHAFELAMDGNEMKVLLQP